MKVYFFFKNLMVTRGKALKIVQIFNSFVQAYGNIYSNASGYALKMLVY